MIEETCSEPSTPRVKWVDERISELVVSGCATDGGGKRTRAAEEAAARSKQTVKKPLDLLKGAARARSCLRVTARAWQVLITGGVGGKRRGGASPTIPDHAREQNIDAPASTCGAGSTSRPLSDPVEPIRRSYLQAVTAHSWGSHIHLPPVWMGNPFSCCHYQIIIVVRAASRRCVSNR